MDIQWMMVHWWVLVHCGRVSAFFQEMVAKI
jgi:hypothetical protein